MQQQLPERLRNSGNISGDVLPPHGSNGRSAFRPPGGHRPVAMETSYHSGRGLPRSPSNGGGEGGRIRDEGGVGGGEAARQQTRAAGGRSQFRIRQNKLPSSRGSPARTDVTGAQQVRDAARPAGSRAAVASTSRQEPPVAAPGRAGAPGTEPPPRTRVNELRGMFAPARDRGPPQQRAQQEHMERRTSLERALPLSASQLQLHIRALQEQNAERDVMTSSRPAAGTTEPLPDILNSHVPPPYSHVRRNMQHRRQQGGERRSRGPPRHLPREMTVLDDEEAQHHVTCNSSCKSCLTTVTTFRWVLVALALLGVCCVVTGIALGAMHMTVGNSFLTLSLMFIGLGVMLVVVVGVGWRCTPAGHEPCHLLFSLGEHEARESRSRQRRRRGRGWHGGMLYPEFRYRRPPPSYSASMQDYQQQLMLAQMELERSAAERHDQYSLPSSAPPTYRSQAPSVRPGIQITFPPPEQDGSKPPTYRSHSSDAPRRPALQISQDVLQSAGTDRAAVSQAHAVVTATSTDIQPRAGTSRHIANNGADAEAASSSQTSSTMTSSAAPRFDSNHDSAVVSTAERRRTVASQRPAVTQQPSGAAATKQSASTASATQSRKSTPSTEPSRQGNETGVSQHAAARVASRANASSEANSSRPVVTSSTGPAGDHVTPERNASAGRERRVEGEGAGERRTDRGGSRQRRQQPDESSDASRQRSRVTQVKQSSSNAGERALGSTSNGHLTGGRETAALKAPKRSVSHSPSRRGANQSPSVHSAAAGQSRSSSRAPSADVLNLAPRRTQRGNNVSNVASGQIRVSRQASSPRGARRAVLQGHSHDDDTVL